MLCEKCGKNEANVKIVQIENDKKNGTASLPGMCPRPSGFSLGFDLGNILSSMFQHGGGLAGKIGRAKSLKQCSTCGFTLGDIQKNGPLGMRRLLRGGFPGGTRSRFKKAARLDQPYREGPGPHPS